MQGRLATMLNGNWMFANFRTYQPDDDIGYTYMPPSGFEFAVVAGLTYNFVNPTTRYQSGMDARIDVGTSWSFSDAF